MNNLYSIETNKEASFLPTKSSSISLEILTEFNLSSCVSISKVDKLNTGSLIYKVVCHNESFILRGSFFENVDTLESQCVVANFLPKKLFLRPILSIHNQYVFEFDGLLWLAYKMIDGHQFSGNLNQLTSILSNTIQMQKGLDFAYKNVDKANINCLTRVKYSTHKWIDIVDWLSGDIENDIHFNLMLNVPEYIKIYFKVNRKKIISMINLVSNLNLDHTIVHYDLQHANILINNDDIHCVDIEDIVVSDKRISIFHGIFKWVRHCIYVNNASYDDAIKWLNGDCIHMLEKEFQCKITLEYIGHYALFKVYSDLYLLLFNLIHCGKGELEYDLLKKIHNIFEIEDLFLNKDKLR
jgi:hypothetical protein